MAECEICSAPLHPNNITGLCRECKLVARNERLSGRREPGEPVPLSEAIALVAQQLGIHRKWQP